MSSVACLITSLAVSSKFISTVAKQEEERRIQQEIADGNVKLAEKNRRVDSIPNGPEIIGTYANKNSYVKCMRAVCSKGPMKHLIERSDAASTRFALEAR
ncbi:hypothetical protein EG68_05881 [Paragonimus skrjabini miyazakii]|uniref:Uncharacterized protein n=1 Tax=Paragonimus skrjabini miyazakii TaxID=59628 RepID=A0A8S9YV16_9TREM|nr:hypothetical protein EG68_05881 [Paragonimus skrjabini miyazakii]